MDTTDTNEGLGGKASRLRALAQNSEKNDHTNQGEQSNSNNQTVANTNSSDTFVLPKSISEKKANWNFSLLPSTREKITQIARERGYKSDSAFLDDMFKNM